MWIKDGRIRGRYSYPVRPWESFVFVTSYFVRSKLRSTKYGYLLGTEHGALPPARPTHRHVGIGRIISPLKSVFVDIREPATAKSKATLSIPQRPPQVRSDNKASSQQQAPPRSPRVPYYPAPWASARVFEKARGPQKGTEDRPRLSWSAPRRAAATTHADATSQADPLPSTFTCLFCNHEKSVTVKLDRKAGVGQLDCRVCGQKFQCAVNCLSRRLSSPGAASPPSCNPPRFMSYPPAHVRTVLLTSGTAPIRSVRRSRRLRRVGRCRRYVPCLYTQVCRQPSACPALSCAFAWTVLAANPPSRRRRQGSHRWR